MVRSVWFAAVAVLASVCAVGCAYHAPTEPTTPLPTPNTTPTTIRITASSRTDQTVGITATLLSGDGHFVPNVTLTLSVDAGTVSPTTATTDVNGAVQATASTPSTTTLHVSGGGVTAQATLPASVAAPISDSVLLNVPGTATAGVPVTMFVSSAATGTWSWNFGDGQSAQTSALSITHTYGQAGRFTVSVTGGSTTASAPITIVSPPAPPTPPPAATTSAAVECTPGNTTTTLTGCHVTLTGADGSALTSTITSVDWDFGDGFAAPNSTGPTPQQAVHQYHVSGTFPVSATVHAPSGTFTAQTTVKIP